VRLVLAKPLHGTVPTIVGLDLPLAKSRLAERRLHVDVRFAKGTAGRVLEQRPSGGVAAAPGMTVRITVGSAG
jgi:beta-lactam-binding protein with PASTA domain